MTPPHSQDLSGFSMLDLFRLETENQTALLTDGLLALERNQVQDQARQLEVLMRAAHSLKGAARMVSMDSAVHVTHAMEDCFVTAQKTNQPPSREQIDILLQGVDLLNRIAHPPETATPDWAPETNKEVAAFLHSLTAAQEGAVSTPPAATVESSTELLEPQPITDDLSSVGLETDADVDLLSAAAVPLPHEPSNNEPKHESSMQAVRVTSGNLNRLLGLAGESIVASRWVDTFTTDLVRLKQMQQSLAGSLQRMREQLTEVDLDIRAQEQLLDILEKDTECREALTDRLTELEVFDRRFLNLSGRLYQEVLDCRMRPFGDVVQRFQRLVRDTARTLDKDVEMKIVGESTPVDRDILERIEAPLGHLLRNAVDHGIESPTERRSAGKPEAGSVQLEARHTAGMLLIEVADDGCGIDMETVRQTIIRKDLASAEVAVRLDDAELLEFLFLPGFTMKDTVTEISGRGVGLDVVQTMVKEVGGSVRISTEPGQGTSFQLQLPLTLSVIRTLLVDIAGEPYAFPLNRISSTLKLPRDKIESIEGHQHFTLGDRQIGLVTAHQILDINEAPIVADELAVVVLGDATSYYGVVMDDFLGERELTVRALDPRLGKVQNISAAALTPDQAPVLIFDVDDLIRSIENLVSGQRLTRVQQGDGTSMAKESKRVLVVDDSLTVRELERKLISGQGYEVEVAVDGMDAWNAVRIGNYDLVVTDVDMPRMDGIELVTLIKKDPRLHALPVMIVSYKDREEDRRRGLEAGADYYLTKGSFHDETLLQAVSDLIGEADA